MVKMNTWKGKHTCDRIFGKKKKYKIRVGGHVNNLQFITHLSRVSKVIGTKGLKHFFFFQMIVTKNTNFKFGGTENKFTPNLRF